MNASDIDLIEQELEMKDNLLSELYQILGQFQEEIPEHTLDKIIATIYGDCNGVFSDEYGSLLPFMRGEK